MVKEGNFNKVCYFKVFFDSCRYNRKYIFYIIFNYICRIVVVKIRVNLCIMLVGIDNYIKIYKFYSI